MPSPGDYVGKYRVVARLASGGMGTVWRAHHPDLDVDVALKVLAVDSSGPGAAERFRREAQAAAKLKSPHIVQVLDYGVADGQPYLAMELLEGEDLASRLAREGRLSPAAAASIVEGVAKAVQVAHDAGIAHRDLKPGNVFLTTVGGEELVKVLDFGIAKDVQASAPALTHASQTLGSPPYMSPEQAWGEAVGLETDVWSIGVIAFEMLTGKNPFYEEKLAKIFERILREPIPSVRDFDAALPSALDEVFGRALAREPAKRFASPRELADAFRRALEAAPPVAPARDRRPWVVAVLLLAVVGLAAALALALGRTSSPIGTEPDAAPAPRETARAIAPRAAPSEPAPATVATPTPSASERPAPPRRAPSAKPSPSAPKLDPAFGIPVP